MADRLGGLDGGDGDETSFPEKGLGLFDYDQDLDLLAAAGHGAEEMEARMREELTSPLSVLDLEDPRAADFDFVAAEFGVPVGFGHSSGNARQPPTAATTTSATTAHFDIDPRLAGTAPGTGRAPAESRRGHGQPQSPLSPGSQPWPPHIRGHDHSGTVFIPYATDPHAYGHAHPQPHHHASHHHHSGHAQHPQHQHQHGPPSPGVSSPTTDAASLSPDDPSRLAAEDKRRRNTAASARFRVKKKQREQELERSTKEISEKVVVLEDKIQQLEMENKWLKELVMEKGRGPKPGRGKDGDGDGGKEKGKGKEKDRTGGGEAGGGGTAT